MKATIAATRLTCFAIISAIEDDLRAFLRAECTVANYRAILPTDVRNNAARRWSTDTAANAAAIAESDLDLLPYIDFLDLSKALDRLRKDVVVPLDVTTLARALEPLAPTRNRVCHTRPLETGDLPLCLDKAEELSTQF